MRLGPWALLLAAGCAAPPAGEEVPHQSLEDFSMHQSVRGRKGWTMKARAAKLIEESNQAKLTEPMIEVYRLGQPALRARGARGTVDLATQDVVLSGAVVLDLLDEDSVLRTEELLFDAGKRQFRSERDVVLERPGAVIRGKGCEADAELREVRIFRQESTYTGGSR